MILNYWKWYKFRCQYIILFAETFIFSWCWNLAKTSRFRATKCCKARKWAKIHKTTFIDVQIAHFFWDQFFLCEILFLAVNLLPFWILIFCWDSYINWRHGFFKFKCYTCFLLQWRTIGWKSLVSCSIVNFSSKHFWTLNYSKDFKSKPFVLDSYINWKLGVFFNKNSLHSLFFDENLYHFS